MATLTALENKIKEDNNEEKDPPTYLAICKKCNYDIGDSTKRNQLVVVDSKNNNVVFFENTWWEGSWISFNLSDYPIVSLNDYIDAYIKGDTHQAEGKNIYWGYPVPLYEGIQMLIEKINDSPDQKKQMKKFFEKYINKFIQYTYDSDFLKHFNNLYEIYDKVYCGKLFDTKCREYITDKFSPGFKIYINIKKDKIYSGFLEINNNDNNDKIELKFKIFNKDDIISSEKKYMFVTAEDIKKSKQDKTVENGYFYEFDIINNPTISFNGESLFEQDKRIDFGPNNFIKLNTAVSNEYRTDFIKAFCKILGEYQTKFKPGSQPYIKYLYDYITQINHIELDNKNILKKCIDPGNQEFLKELKAFDEKFSKLIYLQKKKYIGFYNQDNKTYISLSDWKNVNEAQPLSFIHSTSDEDEDIVLEGGEQFPENLFSVILEITKEASWGDISQKFRKNLPVNFFEENAKQNIDESFFYKAFISIHPTEYFDNIVLKNNYMKLFNDGYNQSELNLELTFVKTFNDDKNYIDYFFIVPPKVEDLIQELQDASKDSLKSKIIAEYLENNTLFGVGFSSIYEYFDNIVSIVKKVIELENEKIENEKIKKNLTKLLLEVIQYSLDRNDPTEMREILGWNEVNTKTMEKILSSTNKTLPQTWNNFIKQINEKYESEVKKQRAEKEAAEEMKLENEKIAHSERLIRTAEAETRAFVADSKNTNAAQTASEAAQTASKAARAASEEKLAELKAARTASEEELVALEAAHNTMVAKLENENEHKTAILRVEEERQKLKEEKQRLKEERQRLEEEIQRLEEEQKLAAERDAAAPEAPTGEEAAAPGEEAAPAPAEEEAAAPEKKANPTTTDLALLLALGPTQ